MAGRARRRQPERTASTKPKPPNPLVPSAPAPSPLTRTLRSFLAHYAAQHTPHRFYATLLPALLAPTTHCALLNPHANHSEQQRRMHAARAVRLHWTQTDAWTGQQREAKDGERKEEEAEADVEPAVAAAEAKDADSDATVAAVTRLIVGLSSASVSTATATDDEDGEDVIDFSTIRFPPPASSLPPSLHLYYLLDPSSLLPVQSLDLAPHHAILDMCAAPGGKSLAILFTIAAITAPPTTPTTSTTTTTTTTGPASYHLTCNELSQPRRQRLQRVLTAYLPPAVRSHVSLTSHSATSATAFPPATYDRVLLDSPCSSSRHLLRTLASLPASAGSAAARSAAYGAEQARMLRVGLRTLRCGGRLVYSTCSLAGAENEDVVAGVLGRWAGGGGGVVREVGVAGEEGWRGERRRYGRLVLPDVAGYGPLYYCVLEKVGDSKQSQLKQQSHELDSDSNDDDDEADEADEAHAADSSSEDSTEG